MAQHEEKSCPRCNKIFECKCGSISLCQCAAVTLSDELTQQLRSHYNDCLCIQCLRDIQLTNTTLPNKITIKDMQPLIMNR